VICVMSVNIGFIDENGADPWLFRGGFFVCSLFTIGIIAAVTHERTLTSRVLAVPLLLWIGTRSYGLYLYSWPIFQMIRDGGRGLTLGQFVFAMAVTLVIVELSYRFIETPIRRGALGSTWRRLRDRRDPGRRTAVLAGAFAGTALTIFAAGSLATADLQQTEFEQTQSAGAAAACDVLADPNCGSDEPEPTVATTVVADAGAVLSTTVAPVPTTEPPPPPVERLAIGDSVMVGAIPALNDRGLVVDAKESRQFSNGVELVEELRADDRLGDELVIHLGTNGPIGADDMEVLMAAVSDVATVVLVTIDADRDYTSGNNALIYDAVNRFPNVRLLDWQGLAGSCLGNCFYSDDIHLRPDGAEYYAQLIAGVLAGQG
ncbi:MAG: acyltransferase family protein, partial [Ilumatobacteraceae bacterium]